MEVRKLKQIEGYKKYAVSECGKVFSLDFNRTGEVRQLSPYTVRGYNHVSLRKDGKRKIFPVHRLVAQAFLDDWEPDLQVDHIDMNRTNNHVSNLRMVTPSQNAQNNNARGICFHKRDKKWYAKLTINYKCYHGPYRDTEAEALADREELIKKYGTLPD
jgi:hypothetical protein